MRRAGLLWLLVWAGCLTEYTVGGPAQDSGCPEGQAPCGDGCAAAGTCDDECPAGQVRCHGECVADDGGCDETCPEGQVECGGECVAADTCPCEQGCDGEREACDGGVCVCRGGLTRCGSVCTDTRADPLHCGGCGGVCGGDEALCQADDCVAACAAPRTACDGACVDVDTDSLHCGKCGEACDADEVCAGGECRGYVAVPGCVACPCDDACGDGGEDGEEEVCCDAPFLGGPVCMEDGCG